MEDINVLRIIEEFPNYSVTDDGMVYSHKSNRWLKRRIYEGSYWGVNLRDKNGKNVYRNCHTLVAKAWLPDGHMEGLIVNHKDLDKSNCHVSNLEWITQTENIRHYVENRPEQASAARREIELEDIDKICILIEEGFSTPEIHDQTGLPKNTISKVRTKALYSWYTEKYNLIPEPIVGLSNNVAKEICEYLEQGLGCKKILDIFNNKHVTKSAVNNIKYRNTFTNISDNYTWWVGKYKSKQEWRAERKARKGETSND